MGKHLTITISVSYDEAYPIPEDMENQLQDNILRCVDNANLLLDSEQEVVVEEWSVETEEAN